MMSTSVKILSDGVVKFDGGSVFGQVPKVAWENSVSTDRKKPYNHGPELYVASGLREECVGRCRGRTER
ncbi:MAG: hypothetical protein CM1200mP15_20170 [Dehalococcoidia bacterium]|nr:MAG: hypothetical protein CM1200mP15_20170 [Dehalococcoidia bacterium]